MVRHQVLDLLNNFPKQYFLCKESQTYFITTQTVSCSHFATNVGMKFVRRFYHQEDGKNVSHVFGSLSCSLKVCYGATVLLTLVVHSMAAHIRELFPNCMGGGGPTIFSPGPFGWKTSLKSQSSFLEAFYKAAVGSTREMGDPGSSREIGVGRTLQRKFRKSWWHESRLPHLCGFI